MYLQNHDMDDLFREAAAGYPLKNRGSDWESVEQKLKPVAGPGQGMPYKGSKFYMLLLLAPVFFLLHNSYTHEGSVLVIESPVLNTGNNAIEPEIIPAQSPKEDRQFAPGIRMQPITDGNKHLIGSVPTRVDHNFEIDIAAASRLPVTEPGEPAIENTKPKPIRGFYYGAAAGLDFATVKAQSFTNAGYNLGILAGYRFNKHFSIESGIFWTQKKYFTRGEHFSMKKIENSMPGGMEMVAVEGQLSLIEIPYKIKYDFLLKERSNFFVTAGSSTNFYVKEKNEYLTRLNGTQQLQKATYTDLHCSPLCLVHVSAGYEKVLRNQSRLRLEPYIKFPLRNIGMGSVPVLSVGLNVSVSNFLDR